MCLRGSLHADTGVRTGVVVEGDEPGYALPCILDALEAMFAIDDLRLQDAVHTLGYGVVSGFVVLCHANLDAIFLQFVRIGITAVLYASVRVMDESFQLVGRSLRDGHPQGLECVFRFQCVREAPTHDLVRIGVCHQVQVAAVAHKVDVRDIAHPELVRTRGYETADEVLVPVVAVVRIRRMTRLRTFLRQLEVAQQLEKRIATRNPVAKEHALRHQPELVVADSRIHLTDLFHGIHDAHHAEKVLLVALLLLVIGLFRSVKQFTAILYSVASIAAQALYCLTPAFFRTLMPCSSITSMSVLSANTLS